MISAIYKNSNNNKNKSNHNNHNYPSINWMDGRVVTFIHSSLREWHPSINTSMREWHPSIHTSHGEWHQSMHPSSFGLLSYPIDGGVHELVLLTCGPMNGWIPLTHGWMPPLTQPSNGQIVKYYYVYHSYFYF